MRRHPGYGQPGWDIWLGARLIVEHLPAGWPGCDERCGGVVHDPALRIVLADLEVERTHQRGGDWWDYGRKTEIEYDPEWSAVGPAATHTPPEARLARLTRLRWLASTDDTWDAIFNPGTPTFEDLFEILDGHFAGGLLVAVTFGPSDIRSGLAGKLIVQDHPPARDPAAAKQRLDAAAPAIERGLPHETSAAD